MITHAKHMTEYVMNTGDSIFSKQSCEKIMQVNTSNKILLGATQGIGNAILTTPLIKALTSMNLKVDILIPESGLYNHSERVFAGMDNVKCLTEKEIAGRIYLLGLQTMWPYPMMENFVAQLRFAPDINKLWEEGISAHEVEVNMSLAYSLKYKGEVPSLYCNHSDLPEEWGPALKGKKNIGIHVCRKYNHQFHANRRLCRPLRLGRELHKRGYRVFIIGHKDAVTWADRQDNQDFIYCLGQPLEAVATFINNMDCMVNEDSGIMHVTAAMDTPQLAIFGPTSDVKNAPWSEKAVVSRMNMQCSPCQYTPRALNCCDNICMDLDIPYIVKQVEALL